MVDVRLKGAGRTSGDTLAGPDHEAPPSERGHVMAESQSTVTYLDVPGFPGYRVGDDGSVWTCRMRVGLGGNRGILRVIGDEWNLLNPNPDRRGRVGVTLYRDGKRYYFRIARLILLAFVGPCPEGMQACHFPDRDPANNRLGNLRWDTPKANQADRVIHGTDNFGDRNPSRTRPEKLARGERHYRAKLTEQSVALIRAKRAQGAKLVDFAAEFGVTHANISYVARGQTWKGSTTAKHEVKR